MCVVSSPLIVFRSIYCTMQLHGDLYVVNVHSVGRANAEHVGGDLLELVH